MMLAALLYTALAFGCGYALATRHYHLEAARCGFGEYDRLTGNFRMFTMEEVRNAEIKR